MHLKHKNEFFTGKLQQMSMISPIIFNSEKTSHDEEEKHISDDKKQRFFQEKILIHL